MTAAAEYIDTFAGLAAWCSHLAKADEVAIDTEADSFFCYREKTCLVQMTAFGEDVIIDPLAISDMSPLAAVLADASCTKILHDAGYDLLCLHRDFGFEFRNVFDTMLASRLVGRRHFGLAALLQEHFDFPADKRYQRSDWGKRPLTEGQLAYARYDTHYLSRLRAILTAELEEQGRLGWAEEEFARLPLVVDRLRAPRSETSALGFWRIAGVRALSPEGKGRLRHLFLARERIARRLDRPIFKVVNDDTLLAMAASPAAGPYSAAVAPDGLQSRQGGGRFHRELTDGMADAPPIDEDPPKQGGGKRRRGGRTLEPAARERYEALREARKQAAERIGLEPEVLLSNAPIEALAKQPPAEQEGLLALDFLQGWRGPILAQPLWRALSACSSPAHPYAKRPSEEVV